jgi:hypothetical protein
MCLNPTGRRRVSKGDWTLFPPLFSIMLIGWIERHSWHWADFPVVAAMQVDVSIVQASILLFGHICSSLDFRLKSWSKIACLSLIQAFVEFAFSTLCWGHFWQQNSAIYSLMHCINYGSIPRCDELWLLAVMPFTYICSVKIHVILWYFWAHMWRCLIVWDHCVCSTPH